MKKFLSILVVVALMAGFLVPSAHAAEGFQIVVSSVNSATAGETVTLTVSLVNNPGVTNGKITVEYDANFFEPVASGAITPGALATNAGATVMSNGYIMNFVAPMGIEGDGVLFNVTLKVKDGATGSGTVKANVSYLKNNGTAVTVAAADGTVAMAPAAHVHETTKVPAKAADCTNPGNTEYYTCACGAWFKDAAATQEITDKNSVVIAAGHSLTDVAEVKATCTAEGTKAHQKCTACGKLFVNNAEVTADSLVIPAGHTLIDVAEVKATCTAEGTKAHQKCTVCGKLFVGGKEVTAAELVIAKAAHDMGEWTQTKAPTETEKGEESRKCKNCDHTEKREVAALGHTCAPVDVAEVPATCTTNGTKAHKKCACGKLYIDGKEVTAAELVIPAGHTLTDVAEVKATCTAEGTKAHQKCGVCGKLFVNGTEVTAAQLVIGKAAHEMGEWTQTKAPTETEKGEETRKCKNCTHTETREVAALGHTCAPVDVAEVKATCTTNGTKAHKKCACGKLYVDGKEVTAADLVIPATGHKAGDPNLEWKDGVCTSVLKCEVCGTVLGEVKLEVKEELTDKDVPAGLKDTEFNTVEKIEEEMKTQLETVGASSNVQVDAENTYLFDVVLMYTDEDGKTQVADKEHFPENGKLIVTLAVPAGTNPTTHKYHVVHMFTSDAFGKKAGDVEVFTNLQAKSDGNGGYYISFEVTGLSPIMICTEEIKEAHTCAPVDVAEVKATCDVDGVKAHQKCACGKLYVDGKEVTAADLVIPAGHTLTDVAEVKATCTANGTKAHQKCSACGKLYVDGKEVTAADLVITAPGHNYVDGTCVNCGDVPKTGDTMISVAVAAAVISAMSIVALPVIKKRF